MDIESQITGIINDKVKNPVYEAMRVLNIKTVLKQSNFSKKEGVSAYMVVLHFVYMLVMNKKIASFRDQSDEAYAKDVYYRFLANAGYNWRKLLSLSTMRILKLLHKLQDSKAVKVLILDDTVENKVGKNIEGSCDGLWSNKEKRKVRGLNIVSLNYSDGFSNFMLDFAIAMNAYARVKIEDFTNRIDHRTNAYKRRLEALKGKSQIAVDMVKRTIHSGVQADYLLVDSWYSKPVFIQTMNELGLQVISRMANNNRIWNFIGQRKTLQGLYDQYKAQKTIKTG